MAMDQGALAIAQANTPVINGQLMEKRNEWGNYDIDIVGIASTAPLSDIQFFANSQKPPAYVSSVPIITQNWIKAISAIAITTDIIWAGTTCGTVGGDEYCFENTAYIDIQVAGKSYPRIPIHNALPYTIARQGAGFVFVPKQVAWFSLKEPIPLENDKRPQIFLRTPVSIVTGVATTILPGLLGTATICHSIRFEIAGPINQP